MIKIEQLLPALKKGWVAMDSNGWWFWFNRKPSINEEYGQWQSKNAQYVDLDLLFLKDIAPVEDWKKSLIRVTGDNDKELEKTKQQLNVALNGLFEIANNPSPDFNRILYAREVWHKVKELKNDN